MEISFLVKSILGLVVVLGLLVFFLILPAKRRREKKKKENTPKVDTPNIKFKELRVVIRNKESSSEELKVALDLLIKHFGNMPEKLGIRAHPDSFLYLDIIFKICRHKNTNKDLIIKFTRELEKLNPSYGKEINDALMKGLNSRGL